METPWKEIRSQDRTVWVTQPHELNSILQREETAFSVAKAKFMESGGNLELVMQTAEAFGRGLFTDRIKQKPQQWTMKHWLETTTKEILNPLGTGATITNIAQDEATTLMFRCLLQEDADDPEIASLFTYGFMRGMLLSAFPQGELLMKSTMAQGAPMTEFVFKSNATEEERMERERVKTFFTTTMKV